MFRNSGAAAPSGSAAPIIPGLLRPIDVKAIAKELNLRSRGTKRGSEDLPKAADDRLDAVERDIEHRILAECGWQFDQLLGMLRAYRDRLAALSVSAEIGKLRLAAQHAIAEFRNADAHATGRLGYHRREYIDARDELRRFQQAHKLLRPAGAKADMTWTAGVLCFLIAIESALNGVFFAKGSDFGLVGGVGTAIGISAVNVIAAFLIGLFPARWLHHRSLLVKGSGLLLTAGGIGLLTFLHYFAAHFREATAKHGADVAFEAAISSLWRSPASLTDIDSWYLFGLGMLFGMSALWKGYRSEDPYPGYGRVARAANDAELAYRIQHEGLFNHLADVRNSVVTQLQEALQRIPVNVQQIEQAKAGRSELIERFSAYEMQLEIAANHLLETYRDANKRARSSPPPEHFEDRWHLPQRAGSTAEATALLADPDGLEQVQINAVLEELRSLSHDVMQVYADLLTKFEHPTEMS